MRNNITLKDMATLLKSRDNILILTHAFPDGDTLGGAYGLALALQKLGKKARVTCPDEIAARYDYMIDPLKKQDFKEQFIVSVDIADLALLDGLRTRYEGRVDLSIDHHPSNRRFAKYNYVKCEAAACELVYRLIKAMGVTVDSDIAAALYTGIATDTGCFRFSNTSVNTLRIAAALMACGAPCADINRVMFDTKSRSRLEIERGALNDMEFFCGGRCAITAITAEMIAAANAADDELEGITALPRSVEGVLLGITVREREHEIYKISMRSHAPINVSELCGTLGGGGHARAAGCQMKGTLQEVIGQLKDIACEFVKRAENA